MDLLPSRALSCSPSRGHYILLVHVTAVVLGPNGNTAGLNAPLKTTFLMLGHLIGALPGVPPSLGCMQTHQKVRELLEAAKNILVNLQSHCNVTTVEKQWPRHQHSFGWISSPNPSAQLHPLHLIHSTRGGIFLAKTQVTHEHGALHTQVGGCRASHSCAAGQHEHQASFPSQGASPGTL